MGCAALDTRRAYYYQNRVRMNVLRMLMKKADINAVAGRSGPLFEILGNDIPISTIPAELLTEVTGYFIFTLIALSMLLSINWQLTLFIFLPLSAAIFGIQRLSERMKERKLANREAQDEASSFIADIIDTSLAVKAAGAEESVLKQFEFVNRNRRRAVLNDTLLNARIGVLLSAAVYVGTAVMMYAAARLMAGGSFGLGDFSLFIAHLGTLADCVNRIVELVAESRKAEVSYERIIEAAGITTGRSAVNNDNDINSDAGITLRSDSVFIQPFYSRKPFLSFDVKNLSYDYGEGKGFRDISFSLYPGELLVITGEIGSGKSTVLNALMGLILPDAGNIFLDKKIALPAGLEPPDMAGVPQRSGFFSGSLRENIKFDLSVSDGEIMEALNSACLDEFAFSGFLDMDPGSRGSKLSGGQQQRLALARMYARKARLNIIDDCISALDEDTRMKVLDRLNIYRRQEQCAVIISTNEPSFINAADKILFMENGYGKFHD